MIVAEALKHIVEHFEKHGLEGAPFEARELIKAAIGWSTADLLMKEGEDLSEEQRTKLVEWAKKRADGVPLAYLLKEKGFFKHIFAVEPGVLVPRPETELVVETALRRAAMAERTMSRIADLGAGTGCIGLSLLYEWPKAELWTVESSPRAAANILKNADQMGLTEKTKIDCISVETWDPETTFDLVVANPPYIAVGDPNVQKSVHKHEPHAALYAGADGLDAFRAWIPVAHRFLESKGLCIFEIGSGQSESVRAIMGQAGFGDIQIGRDLAGHDRVVSAVKP